MGVQQRSSQSSVNKGPQQTLSEIQRGMVARKFFKKVFTQEKKIQIAKKINFTDFFVVYFFYRAS